MTTEHYPRMQSKQYITIITELQTRYIYTYIHIHILICIFIIIHIHIHICKHIYNYYKYYKLISAPGDGFV